MASLSGALSNASHTLDVLESAIGLVQSNVANASTPGYVTQTQQLAGGTFDPFNNLWGGLEAGPVQDSRNNAAENNVWRAAEQSGTASAQSNYLGILQSSFDVSGKSGLAAAMSGLSAAFSAWSADPNSAVTRGQVLTAARSFAQAFNDASKDVAQARTSTVSDAQAAVDQINQISAQLATLNQQIRQGAASASVQAQLYDSLERLSGLTNIEVHAESDGTATVLLGGQIPLVIGATSHAISLGADSASVSSGAPPLAVVKGSDGQDITAKVTGGSLAGLVGFANSSAGSLTGNATGPGSLNSLAKTMADRVNSLLISGTTSSGAPGMALFTYNVGQPGATAATLAVNGGIDASQLAAAQTGPPASANGTATKLARLSTSSDPADQLAGLSYLDFYSQTASSVAQQASAANQAKVSNASSLTQAQALRAQLSGISLNDQATTLLAYQKAYQASAQTISVINSTIQSLMQMMNSVS